MALHDVSKDHPNRLNPAPNQNDELLQRLAQGTTQVQNVKDTSTPTGKIKINESQIIVNDGTNDRILIGYLSGGF